VPDTVEKDQETRSESRRSRGRGYVVLSGTIGGEYARGSIVPEDRFEEDRINHWVARGVIRRANEDDIEAAKGIQPSGSVIDTGSRAPSLTPEEQAAAAKGARVSEINRLEALVEQLKKEDEEATKREEAVAKEQTRAMKAANEALGLGETRDPRAPHRENPSPESTQSSSDDPTPHDAKDEPDSDSDPPAEGVGLRPGRGPR